MTFNYTDLDVTGGVPLGQPWERVGMEEVAEILSYLTQGLFINPADFADRLRQTAETIEELGYCPEETEPPDEPA